MGYLLNGGILSRISTQMMDGHIKYGLGAKPRPLSCAPKDIFQIDCSGFVRYMIYHISANIIPDGSWNQNDWCSRSALNEVDYDDDAGRFDNILRMAFIMHSKTIKVGHVWLVLNGLTLESHGMHGGISGPDRRDWDNEFLLPNVSHCYELGVIYYLDAVTSVASLA